MRFSFNRKMDSLSSCNLDIANKVITAKDAISLIVNKRGSVTADKMMDGRQNYRTIFLDKTQGTGTNSRLTGTGLRNRIGVRFSLAKAIPVTPGETL